MREFPDAFNNGLAVPFSLDKRINSPEREFTRDQRTSRNFPDFIYHKEIDFVFRMRQEHFLIAKDKVFLP